jgi:hypothetical protein
MRYQMERYGLTSVRQGVWELEKCAGPCSPLPRLVKIKYGGPFWN